MKEIPLTQGQFALVDDADYDYLMQWKWYAKYDPAGYTFYAERNQRVTEADYSGKRRQIRMHTVITGYVLTDHIDGNGLNNTRANLREATHSQNMHNRQSVAGSSQYKGVSWHKQHEKWKASIRVNGKGIHLGYFIEEIDAARAYNQAAIEHFGEYARLNGV